MAAWYRTDEAKEVAAELGYGADDQTMQAPLVRGFLMTLRGDVEMLFGAGPDVDGACEP